MFRSAIEQMAPYLPGEQPRPGERLIKLNTNENPYPPSPRVRRAIVQAAAAETLRLYPRPRADPLVAAAARYYRLPRNMILAGNGSDELLAMLFRATLDAGDLAAWAVPTYSLYDTLAAIAGARVERIELGRDFSLPLSALARARARLTIVCNPNSPSGTLVAQEELIELARRLHPRLLAIDEAYVDFADRSSLRLVRSLDNVLILRTMSKSFSLAGMRLGLLLAPPPLIEQLLKVKDSYNLNCLAQAAGAAALADAAWALRNVERVRRTRRMSEAGLRKIGFEVPPSAANFVLARMAGVKLEGVAAGLRRRGILVRYFDTPLLYDCLRITIGKPTEMKTLLQELAPLAAAARASAATGAGRVSGRGRTGARA